MIIKKKLFILALSIATVFLGGIAFGACFDIQADWDLSCKGSFYEPDTGNTGFTSSSGILHITDQRGCRFIGSAELPSDPVPIQPITGVIRGNTIRMTGSKFIVEGSLINPNRINATSYGLGSPGYNVINTDLCKAIRR